jgi:hypothetical protein
MAPNKKYLSLEEAAAQIGIKTEDLIRLREKGEVRGFADRGTWKFKADDVAEYRRRQQPDSDPNLQIIDDFNESESDDVGNQATVIRKGGPAKSDSDVRLVSDDADQKKNRLTGSSAELPSTGLHDSDSDVRLVEPSKGIEQGSDSDVTLVIPRKGMESDSDSDVRMVDLPDSRNDSKSRAPADTDSDIRLSPFSDSDSDVQLIGPKSKGGKPGSDSDVALFSNRSKSSAPTDESDKTLDMGPPSSGIDFDLIDSERTGSALHDGDDSSITLAGDSGIQLAGADSGISLGGDSGIRLGGDSGIRFGGGDSGIRLGGDSGIRLSAESGVQLKKPADSGISLEGADSGVRLADSGINLGEESGIRMKPASSKIKKEGSSKNLKGSKKPAEDDLEATVPMHLDSLSDDDLSSSTAPFLSSISDDEVNTTDLDSFNPSDTSELQSIGDLEQNVVMFDDDEEDAPPVSSKKKQKTVEESIFEIDEVEDGSMEELEVSDDDLSGENEIDDLAFDDDDIDSEDGFSGSSKLGMGSGQKVPVAQEAEWSAGFLSLLFASLLFLVAGSWMAADLLHNVWSKGEESPINPGIAGILASLWK